MIDLNDLTQYWHLLVWPVALWAARIQISVERNTKALDYLYYEKRGNKGMRCRSIGGRIRRAVYALKNRGKKHEGNLS